MADMHITTGDGERWTIVMHFPVPDVNNDVAVNYRTALVNSGIGGTTVMAEGVDPGQIGTTEKTAIEAGEVFEHVGTFRVESGGTSNVQLRDSIREFYTRAKVDVIDDMKSRLRYYGHTESGS